MRFSERFAARYRFFFTLIFRRSTPIFRRFVLRMFFAFAAPPTPPPYADSVYFACFDATRHAAKLPHPISR